MNLSCGETPSYLSAVFINVILPKALPPTPCIGCCQVPEAKALGMLGGGWTTDQERREMQGEVAHQPRSLRSPFTMFPPGLPRYGGRVFKPRLTHTIALIYNICYMLSEDSSL